MVGRTAARWESQPGKSKRSLTFALECRRVCSGVPRSEPRPIRQAFSQALWLERAFLDGDVPGLIVSRKSETKSGRTPTKYAGHGLRAGLAAAPADKCGPDAEGFSFSSASTSG
jgi:hypothetical protein